MFLNGSWIWPSTYIVCTTTWGHWIQYLKCFYIGYIKLSTYSDMFFVKWLWAVENLRILMMYLWLHGLLLIPMVGSFLAPKWPIMVPFCGMVHRKSKFSLISDTFSVRGCWGHLMLLFWKLVDETQMGNPHNHAVKDISSKFSIFLPLRAISKKPYHYETPCRC